MSNITEREIQKKAELLGPGSVWESTRGSRYTVLAVTNLAIASRETSSARQRQLFPISVVFLNEDNEIFSCEVDRFLRMYEWVYNDDVVDTYISQVYAANAGDLGPVDRKRIEKEQKEKAVMAADEESATLAQQMLGGKYTIKFLPTTDEVKPLLSSEALAEALTSYSVNLDSTGARFYKFVFATNSVVDQRTISKTFNPEEYGDEENTYQKFTIESDIGVRDEIAWNTYCGISLEIINHESFIALTLADTVEGTQEEPVKEENTVDIEDELARLQAHIEEGENEPEVEATPEVEQNAAEVVTEDTPEVVQTEVVEQEPLPTEAPIEVVATDNVREVEPVVIEAASEDLNLDDNDLVVEDQPSTPTESSAADVVEEVQEDAVKASEEVTADPETPHTLSSQLANTLAKQLIAHRVKEG
nr:MAG TPA: hypothetical protein [Caudoviricetes sp.]